MRLFALNIHWKISYNDKKLFTEGQFAMKNSIRIILLPLMTTILFSIPHTYANTTEPVNVLDDTIHLAQKQLGTVRQKLSELSSMINNGQINTLKNKNDAINNIKNNIKMVDGVLREKFVHIDPQTVLFITQLTNKFVNHIEKSLKNGFPHFQEFDLGKAIKRAKPIQDITLEKLQAEIKRNKRKINILSKHMDNAGLRWYNLAYRKFDSNIIEPCQKHSIPRRTFEIGAITSCALLCWWRFNNTSFENRMKSLNDFFGEVPNEKLDQPLFQDKTKLNLLGNLEISIRGIKAEHWPILATFAGISYKVFSKEWNNYWPEVTKWFTIQHNLLKGGAYINRANKFDENVVEDVNFDDIIGLQRVKDKFGLLVKYLENPEPFDRLGLTPQKGCLLIGESRTGKTYSVKALKNEIKKMLERTNQEKKFRYIELEAPFINKEGIGLLLSIIKEKAPCIVFIDEIDLLNLQRIGNTQMLSEFLTCMSGTLDSKDPKNQVIIIAATNKPENLDFALRQPGRFGLELRYEFPNLKNRKELLTRKLDKLSLDVNFFDLDKLACETEGLSYEALNMIVDQALLKARVHGQILSQQHLELTFDEEIRGIMSFEDKTIPESERHLLATHFAGHGLALTLLDAVEKLSEITIKPVMTKLKEEFVGNSLFNKEDEKQKRYMYGQVFTHHDLDTVNALTREQQITLCKYHLAGIVAEEIILGSAGYSCHADDMKKAVYFAQTLAFEGLDIDTVPKHIKKERFNKALAIINQCKQEVKALLEQHKDVLATIIDALKEKETLSAHEIRDFVFPEQKKAAENKEDEDNLEDNLIEEDDIIEEGVAQSTEIEEVTVPEVQPATV